MALKPSIRTSNIKEQEKSVQVAEDKNDKKAKKTTKKVAPKAKKTTSKAKEIPVVKKLVKNKKPVVPETDKSGKKVNPNFSYRAKEDYILVSRALNDGEQKAYANLMARYRDSVNYVLLKMVHNNEDAEDLTIEAFAKAFKKLEKYDPQYSFSTWLYKIAINSAIDFIRRQKREKSSAKKTVSLDEPFSNKDGDVVEINIQANTLDPEEKYIKEQRKRLVREVVEQLSPRYRTLIELRYFRELSYQEISDELQQPIGTIKAQLFRAREVLNNILKKTQDRI